MYVLFAATVVLPLFALSFPASTSFAAAEQWAAQAFYDSETLSPVVYAKSVQLAHARWLKLCLKLSTKGCRNDRNQLLVPTVAQVGKQKLLVTIGCKQDETEPERFLTIATDQDEEAGRKKAFDLAVDRLNEAGYQTHNCWIEAVYEVDSGKKLWK